MGCLLLRLTVMFSGWQMLNLSVNQVIDPHLVTCYNRTSHVCVPTILLTFIQLTVENYFLRNKAINLP